MYLCLCLSMSIYLIRYVQSYNGERERETNLYMCLCTCLPLLYRFLDRSVFAFESKLVFCTRRSHTWRQTVESRTIPKGVFG